MFSRIDWYARGVTYSVIRTKHSGVRESLNPPVQEVSYKASDFPYKFLRLKPGLM